MRVLTRFVINLRVKLFELSKASSDERNINLLKEGLIKVKDLLKIETYWSLKLVEEGSTHAIGIVCEYQLSTTPEIDLNIIASAENDKEQTMGHLMPIIPVSVRSSDQDRPSSPHGIVIDIIVGMEEPRSLIRELDDIPGDVPAAGDVPRAEEGEENDDGSDFHGVLRKRYTISGVTYDRMEI